VIGLLHLASPAHHPVIHRLHQIWLALTLRTPPHIDSTLLPNEHVRLLFNGLHPHDQRHLIAVYEKAVAAGLPPNVCTAGLLHDIGKVTLAGTRISLAARIAHVLLQRFSPSLEARLIQRSGPWLGVGLRLAQNHGRLGADRLRALAVDTWICEIVERHDDCSYPDHTVHLLQEIDSATP
jgi:hypothetical protein